MTTSTPEERLAALGLTLPAVPTPMANYVPYRLAGNLLFLSGQGPKRADGSFMVGRLGKDASVEQGYEAARLTGLQLLAVAKAALGELSRVEAVVKLLGMVNAEPDFGDHPKVINGCSDLMVEVLGEAGRHARSAVGMGSLPNRIMVEIEAILLIRAKQARRRSMSRLTKRQAVGKRESFHDLRDMRGFGRRRPRRKGCGGSTRRALRRPPGRRHHAEPRHDPSGADSRRHRPQRDDQAARRRLPVQ